LLSGRIFTTKNSPKSVFSRGFTPGSRGSVPDPAGGAPSY